MDSDAKVRRNQGISGSVRKRKSVLTSDLIRSRHISVEQNYHKRVISQRTRPNLCKRKVYSPLCLILSCAGAKQPIYSAKPNFRIMQCCYLRSNLLCALSLSSAVSFKFPEFLSGNLSYSLSVRRKATR